MQLLIYLALEACRRRISLYLVSLSEAFWWLSASGLDVRFSAQYYWVPAPLCRPRRYLGSEQLVNRARQVLCQSIDRCLRVLRLFVSGVQARKFVISPARALPYRPLGSRCSHSSKGVLIKTSIKLASPIGLRASSLSRLNGEIKAVITNRPASVNRRATSATRRMFSCLSASLKLRSRTGLGANCHGRANRCVVRALPLSAPRL